jgi:hypothetical protein
MDGERRAADGGRIVGAGVRRRRRYRHGAQG